MRYHEMLTEARVRFTKAQLEQAAAEHDLHVIAITMLTNGDIVIGDVRDRNNPEAHPRRSITATVWWDADHKELDFRAGSHGNLVMPRVQQTLRALRDAGIIDASWTIRTRREYGYYPIDDYKYRRQPEPVDDQSLDQLVDKAIRLSPVSQHLVFYHGTSGLDWLRIQKVGLHPLFVGSNTQHGYESRGKHEGNDRVLYLASTVEKAMDYAKLRSKSNNRRLHGSEYTYTENNDPVVLQVEIPDPARLVADDDLIIRLAQRIARRLWKVKPHETQQEIMAALSQQQGFAVKDPTIGEMLWRETADGFAEIMQRLPKRAFQAWIASLKNNDQVGYRGIIPPKFIRLVMQTKQG